MVAGLLARLLIGLGVLLGVAAQAQPPIQAPASEPRVPLPPLIEPTDNPSTLAKVRLGERLFDEPLLSAQGTMSCATCHQPERHFTDGQAVAIGVDGAPHQRNTPTLYNVGYNASYGWSDDGIYRLEAQLLIPLGNRHPQEMGFDHHTLPRLLQEDGYADLFAQAFAGEQISVTHLTAALASYLRSLAAPVSAFDRHLFFDDSTALSDAAKRGLDLFFSPSLGCASCHASFNLSGPVRHQRSTAAPVFHVMGVGGSPLAFRAPTLRSVVHTAPYMHDGSVPTLAAVVARYENIAALRLPHDRVPQFTLTDAQRGDLVAFLGSL